MELVIQIILWEPIQPTIEFELRNPHGINELAWFAVTPSDKITVWLQPHSSNSPRTANESDTSSDPHPCLRMLPDVAHLMIAGDNLNDLPNSLYSKLAAVHLTDWTHKFGQ